MALASLSGKISGAPLKFCKRSAAHLIFNSAVRRLKKLAGAGARLKIERARGNTDYNYEKRKAM